MLPLHGIFIYGMLFNVSPVLSMEWYPGAIRNRVIIQHFETETKRLPFDGRHFEMHFLDLNEFEDISV